ncbi:MAG: GAF domain-containing protein, partial [Gaiellaceae bacterium]
MRIPSRKGPRRQRGGSGKELESVSRVAGELARTADVEGVARTLLDEIATLFGVSFAGLTFVSDDGSEAVGYLARSAGRDVAWWRDLRLDLESEPSGVASAVFEAAAFAVYDAHESNVVSPRLVEATGARSAAFVPLLVQERVIAVISVATDNERRIFSAEDLALMQTLASEAAVALERLRSGVALEEALAENEERLSQQAALLRAAHALSSELDLGFVLQRLADQLAGLLDADAADCYLLDRERGVFRCVAVHGLDQSLLGFEFPIEHGLAGAAVREGRPLIESAYGEIEQPVQHPAYEAFTDAITAPMSWSEEVRGVLGVGRRSDRRFRSGDAGVLEAFAGLASLAVRNAETFTQSARQARIQRGFYRIASVLGQSLSRSATLEAVAQAAAEALGGSSASVLVASSGRLEPVGTYDLPEAVGKVLEQRAATREGPLFRTAAEGRIMASPAIADDERLLPDLREASAANGYRSMLAVPVDAPRGAGRGLVLIFFSEERSFTDDDLELARHLGDATRGALERSELFEAERSARALAQQLTRTGRLLTSELDPAAVLDEVVQQAPALVNAEAAAFRLLEGEELVVTAAEGTGIESALGSRSPAGGWLSGDVVQSGAPLALTDAGADERLRALDPMLAAGLTAFLGIPVGGPEGDVVGVLAVYAELPREWREEEIEALQAVAASTSAALSNAELYQRVALERERSVAILANIAEGIVAG